MKITGGRTFVPKTSTFIDCMVSLVFGRLCPLIFLARFPCFRLVHHVNCKRWILVFCTFNFLFIIFYRFSDFLLGCLRGSYCRIV